MSVESTPDVLDSDAAPAPAVEDVVVEVPEAVVSVPETVVSVPETVPDISEREPVEMQDITPDPERDEIERLLGDKSNLLKLSSGSTIRLKPLKLREFLRMLRIISRGSSSLMGAVDFDFDSTDGFVQSLLALVLFAVPEAENETVEFIQSMCEPEKLTGNRENDEIAYRLLAEELDNPELEDMANIIAVVIRTEGADLRALGKRLRLMFEVAQKMGVAPSLSGSPS